jgi:hypothetical protein
MTEREQWDSLVTELDAELLLYGPVRHQLGKILYEMKVHLHKNGLDRGRKGRWELILRERQIEKSTARDWVVKYQQAEGIPLENCFFRREVQRVKKTRNSHKYGKNNRAVPALFDPRVVAASEVDSKKADESEDKRTAVECVFVLTYGERLTFMKSVRKLGELRATQAMYKAVVTEGNGA